MKKKKKTNIFDLGTTIAFKLSYIIEKIEHKKIHKYMNDIKYNNKMAESRLKINMMHTLNYLTLLNGIKK